MTTSTPSLLRTVLTGLVAGGIATAAKSQAEGLLQTWTEQAAPPSGAEHAQLGADPAGHPENMPPSELADRVQHAVTGEQLTDEQRAKVSDPLHWGMGVGFGVAYALLARRVPQIRAAGGLAAGAALFAATHGSTLPAAKLQHPPWRMPTAWWGWEGGSHLVYGAVLDAGVRGLDEVVEHA